MKKSITSSPPLSPSHTPVLAAVLRHTSHFATLLTCFTPLTRTQFYDTNSAGKSGALSGNKRLEELLVECGGGESGVKQAVEGIKASQSVGTGRHVEACLRAAMARKAWEKLVLRIEVGWKKTGKADVWSGLHDERLNKPQLSRRNGF